MKAKIDEQGRIFLPSAIRKAMAVRPGSELVIQLEDGRAVLESRDEAIAAIQRRLKGRRRGRRSAVDEFLAERHREAKRELGK